MAEPTKPTTPTNLATAKTSSEAFQRGFLDDPVRALSAKGIELSATEAKLLREDLAELANRPEGAAKIKIRVKVKVSVGVEIRI